MYAPPGGALGMLWPNPMSTSGVYPFERIDEGLPFIPLAARRVLDVLGLRLSLQGWLSLPLEDRRAIVLGGTAACINLELAAMVGRATPGASRQAPQAEPDETSAPPALTEALGASRPVDDARWRGLRPLDRYTLLKCAPNPEKLALAYEQILGPSLTHLSAAGEARMVDVGSKKETVRRAVATARVTTTRAVIEAIASGTAPKGDVLAAARMAGILAAKRTPELVPLCHPVRTTSACIEFEPDADRGQLRVRAVVEAIDRTGVEMEAMVAACVASLTAYDMIKSIDRWAIIEAVGLESKSGGKSGSVQRPPQRTRP